PANEKRKSAERVRRRTGARSAPEQFDPATFLSTVGAGRTLATYKPRSYIFRQGAECAAVFYILKGHVDLSVVSKQGKERVVGQLGRDSFIGEGCLAGHPRYLASARAATEATVVRLETRMLAGALNEHPELARQF